MVRQPKQPIREQADVRQETSALSSSGDLFSCPQEGCVRVFQRFSGLERHPPLEVCALCPEKYSLLDLAKLVSLTENQIRMTPVGACLPKVSAIDHCLAMEANAGA